MSAENSNVSVLTNVWFSQGGKVILKSDTNIVSLYLDVSPSVSENHIRNRMLGPFSPVMVFWTSRVAGPLLYRMTLMFAV